MFAAYAAARAVSAMQGPLAVLDACAAPGGKTTAVTDTLPAGSLVVANEWVPARAGVLRENMVKWGYPSTVVTRGGTASLGTLGEAFDLIVADVPCSGEGMMRKDSEARSQWTPQLVASCASLQWEIVTGLWPALKPGGYMIYSTCTLNDIENERNVARMARELGAECVPLAVDSRWGITPALGPAGAGLHAYRFIPGRTRGEGLFLALLRKRGDWTSTPAAASCAAGGRRKDKGRHSAPGAGTQPRGKGPAPSPATAVTAARAWLAQPGESDVYCESDRVSAFPSRWMPLLARLKDTTQVIHEGVHMATLKGRDIIPAHSLAMAAPGFMAAGAFPACPVDTAQALDYLRGNAPQLPPGTPLGHVLLTCLDSPLGWVKNLGRRCNNLYPQPWRLRM